MHQEILKTLTDMLVDLTDEPGLVLTDTTTADDVDTWDSLVQVKLMIAIESHYGIRFETAEINASRNVGELARLIASKLKK